MSVNVPHGHYCGCEIPVPSNMGRRLFCETEWVSERSHLSEAVEIGNEGGQGVLVM